MIPLTENSEPAPDLLRRFMATPHHALWRIGGLTASVKTNRDEVLRCFPELGMSPSSYERPILEITVVIDDELQLADTTVPLAIDGCGVLFGRSSEMFFALDWNSKQLVIFVSRFERSVLAEFLSRLMQEQLAAMAANAS